MKVLIITTNKSGVSTRNLVTEAEKKGHTVTVYENEKIHNILSDYDVVITSEKQTENEIKKVSEFDNPRNFEEQRAKGLRKKSYYIKF